MSCNLLFIEQYYRITPFLLKKIRFLALSDQNFAHFSKQNAFIILLLRQQDPFAYWA